MEERIVVADDSSLKKAVDLLVVGEERESSEEDNALYCRFGLNNILLLSKIRVS